MSGQSCGKCSLFNAAAAMDTRGRILSSRHVRCFWKSIEDYPVSIQFGTSRPVGGYTSSKNGTDCLCFTPIKSEKQS